MIETRQLLRTLYLDRLRYLGEAVHGVSGLSHPLLIDPEAHRYSAASRRLMVVGQETFGWGDGNWNGSSGSDLVDRLLRCYGEFDLGRNRKIMPRKSPFWIAAHQINERLNPGESAGFLWSNLYKVDQAQAPRRRHRPTPEVERALLTEFNVLPREIELARPCAAVFFTGPNYDGMLAATFPNVRWSAIPDLGADAAQFVVRLEHPGLPITTIRSYHPAYLWRKKQRNLIGRIAEWIAAETSRVEDGRQRPH